MRNYTYFYNLRCGSITIHELTTNMNAKLMRKYTRRCLAKPWFDPKNKCSVIFVFIVMSHIMINFKRSPTKFECCINFRKPTSGSICINGRLRNEKMFRRRSCYILQDDRVQDMLTIQESLHIAADLKLGNHISGQQKKRRVSVTYQIQCNGLFQYLNWLHHMFLIFWGRTITISKCTWL